MRLNQVTVPAVELAASIAFYRRLGLRLIVRDEHYARFELPSGDATFSLEAAPHGPGPHAPTVYFELESVAALDALVARLHGEGVSVQHPPVDQPWLWREARVVDPAGNVLCLHFAGRNRTHPPWRLGDAPA